MPDDESGTQVPSAENAEKSPAEEPKKEADPYEGLNEDERAAAVEAEKVWQRLTPRERAVYHDMALAENARRLAPAAEPTPKADKTTKKLKPAAAEEDDDDDNPVSLLRKDVMALREDMKRRDQREEQLEFASAVNAAIAASPATNGDEMAAALVRSAALAEFAQARAAGRNPDIAAIAAKQVKILEERDRKRGYVAAKLETRGMAGESAGGRTAAEKTIKFKGSDLESGAHLRRLQEKAGLSG